MWGSCETIEDWDCCWIVATNKKMKRTDYINSFPTIYHNSKCNIIIEFGIPWRQEQLKMQRGCHGIVQPICRTSASTSTKLSAWLSCVIPKIFTWSYWVGNMIFIMSTFSNHQTVVNHVVFHYFSAWAREKNTDTVTWIGRFGWLA